MGAPIASGAPSETKKQCIDQWHWVDSDCDDINACPVITIPIEKDMTEKGTTEKGITEKGEDQNMTENDDEIMVAGTMLDNFTIEADPALSDLPGRCSG